MSRLICPACGDPAQEQPPTVVHTDATPPYSHPTGDPQCPIAGADGSTRDDTPSAGEQRWRQVLAALRAAGERAGQDAAQWWAQDAIGGRASGNAAVTARAVPTGIDDGDPAVVDTLPICDLSGRWANTATESDCYRDGAPCGAPHWDDLPDQARAEAIDAYRDGFDTAANDAVAQRCRALLDEPDSDHEPAND